jgi:hypothetical protein
MTPNPAPKLTAVESIPLPSLAPNPIKPWAAITGKPRPASLNCQPKTPKKAYPHPPIFIFRPLQIIYLAWNQHLTIIIPAGFPAMWNI